jgi:hypothetical protein
MHGSVFESVYLSIFKYSQYFPSVSPKFNYLFFKLKHIWIHTLKYAKVTEIFQIAFEPRSDRLLLGLVICLPTGLSFRPIGLEGLGEWKTTIVLCQHQLGMQKYLLSSVAWLYICSWNKRVSNKVPLVLVTGVGTVLFISISISIYLYLFVINQP